MRPNKVETAVLCLCLSRSVMESDRGHSIYNDFIVIHKQTVSLCHNFSVWLDTLVTSSWDRNPPNFRLGLYLTAQPFWRPNHLGNSTHYILAFICLDFTLLDTGVLNSFEELCNTRWQSLILSPECSTTRGERVYCHPQTDCSVASKLFSMAWHAGCVKLGSKLA